MVKTATARNFSGQLLTASSERSLRNRGSTSGPARNMPARTSLGLKSGSPMFLASLLCWYTNATSVVNKWSEFKATLAILDYPDVVALTEPWFVKTSLIKLDKYTLYSRDRPGDARGGGVAIYIKNSDSISSNEISVKISPNDLSEQIWCEVRHANEKILIGCV